MDDGIDVSRTVGWFTSLFPVRLDVGGIDLNEDVKRVKEQLHGVPGKGLGYGLLRYMSPETGPRLAGLGEAQIGFNYLGRFSAGEGLDWAMAAESVQLAAADPEMPLAHLVEVNAVTVDGPE